MSSVFSDMKDLQEGLVAASPGIEADLTTFPLGGAMLDVRRGGHAFVMAYLPNVGFGVDELHEDEGLLNKYRFVFDDFEAAARKLRALAIVEIPSNLPPPTLSLIVLRSTDIDAAKEFYGLLGFSFVLEQHGKGPRHYAATVGDLVFELYPCERSNTPAPVHIGFRVPCLDETLARLRRHGVRIISEARDSPWGRRAVVEDPAQNRVELTLQDLGDCVAG